ncbi:deoxyguanosinetriphosphate triphosphohydrolase [Wohlfahrtiimonas larvae]|uniref:Deoxyguanosinetriphosphate triphosphohydrolase n=1 Tax=Wohlfahrtiimonas larvae TaxID=1157986 RepID=A0ABP9MD93_9GAMM|nr:deoxyguanosinetriphosphate triphosphohydrolase [Wohlfahrtiimonas larvae]
MTKMNWQHLLTRERLGVANSNDTQQWYRSTFQKDYDRLIFSAAFRRLQDKTQVFPLAQTDYVRTRLTHSLEVSSVARSIGMLVGQHLSNNFSLGDFRASDIGTILSAAALAHDIGNPPFGHAGEDGIGQFFADSPVGQKALEEMSLAEQQDLLNFEGNAQAFRLLTKLQNVDNDGGMQLSLSTLASFIKYPCGSLERKKINHVALKKFNFFQAEKESFRYIVDRLGMVSLLKENNETIAWARHPLVYLLEAADDLCYSLVDVEDAYRLSLISSGLVINFYQTIIDRYGGFPNKVKRISRDKDKIEYLRAFAMGLLIDEVVAAFIKYEEQILKGECEVDLLSLIPSADALANIKSYAYDHIYVSKPVLEVGIAGHEIIDGLLKAFVGAVNQEYYLKSTSKSRMLISFLPDQFLGPNRKLDDNPYLRILKITDFISGMTDRYAVHVYQMISGVHLTT